MEAGMDDEKAALAEAKDSINEFKKLKFDATQHATSNTLGVTILNAEGEDKHGPAKIALLILGAPKAKYPILASFISSPDGHKTHLDAINGIIKSLQPSPKGSAAKAAKDEPASSGNAQTFAYPAKGKPTYSFEIPADWKMQKSDEGVNIVSADQGIGMNVLTIDMAGVETAAEAIKKRVGADYKSIEWAPPMEKKEADKGIHVKSEDATAMDDDGKYKVSVLQLIKKGSDKFIVIIVQAPEKAVTAGGEACMKFLMSMKVN